MDKTFHKAGSGPAGGPLRKAGNAAGEGDPAAKSLTDADISSRRRITRRSLLGSLGLGLGVAALAVAGGATMGVAQGPGCTDNDGGQFTDPPGRGRTCQPPGQNNNCSDFDGGQFSDPPGRGRSCQPRRRPTRPTACTDMDSGPSEDPPGYGVRCSTWI